MSLERRFLIQKIITVGTLLIFALGVFLLRQYTINEFRAERREEISQLEAKVRALQTQVDTNARLIHSLVNK